jgi:DHA1 family inner membrane transport protein
MLSEFGVFRVGQVWLTLGIGAIGFGGFFAVYSYVSPLVTEIAGSPEWAVPIVLVLVGIGMTVGNLLGGYLADRDLQRTLIVGMALLAGILVLLAVLSTNILLLGLLAMAVGAVSAMLSPAIQTRLMDVAGDNQSIAAALNHSALNIGNSLGAFLGGAAIALGWGYTAPAWIGAALALVGLGITVLAFRMQRQSVIA